MGKWQFGFRSLMLVAIGLGVACSDEPAPKGATPAQPAPRQDPPAPAPPPVVEPPPVAETRSQAELVEAGRGAYNANCIACHSMDPTQDGALGPAVADASLELLQARVVRGVYPPDYVPKRDTRVMIALPHLEPRIGELEAYLGSL